MPGSGAEGEAHTSRWDRACSAGAGVAQGLGEQRGMENRALQKRMGVGHVAAKPRSAIREAEGNGGALGGDVASGRTKRDRDLGFSIYS